MKDLKHWQDAMKATHKDNNFEDFLKYVASWAPLVFHKVDGTVSRYPKSDRIWWVKHIDEFEKTRDSLTDHGIDYDESKDIFDNLGELMQGFHFPALIRFYQNHNSDFADVVIHGKNVYMSYASIDAEDILYSCQAKNYVNHVVSSVMVFDHSEQCYMSLSVLESYKVFFSKYILNSNNIWLSSDLVWCSECILCHGLENKSYCIENVEYKKHEYLVKKEEILKNKQGFLKIYKTIKWAWKNHNSIDSSGTNLIECDSVEWWYHSNGIHNGRNIIFVWWGNGNENMYDTYQAWGRKWDDFYGVCGGWNGASNIFYSSNINGGTALFYSLFLEDCSYCIGCIGLRNKQYCILNKQYSKEQWMQKADEIFSIMQDNGTLGNFFPWHINPFYFNDTMAWLIWGFTKQQVEADGYLWRDEEIKVDIPEWTQTIGISEVEEYQGYDEKW